ncbi:MAG: ATP-binding protein [Planctomycetota bacterium]
MTKPAPSDSLAATTTDAMHEELRRLRTMATLGELTSTATHEFNNVLMTIINYAQLGMRNQDDAARDRAFAKIHDAAKRASAITGTILAQARNRGDSMAPVALSGLIESAMVLLGRELQKYRIAVEMELGENAPDVWGSGNELQRVLINLIVNARQAMPDGGTLLIKTAMVDEGRFVELMVRDSGQGIAAEQLPRIFEPYFSTKAGPDETGKGGTGLGLAASKEIIDRHQGKIRVESTPGRGTAFLIRLPAAGVDQQSAA